MTERLIFAVIIALGAAASTAVVTFINDASTAYSAQVMTVRATCHAVPLLGPNSRWERKT